MPNWQDRKSLNFQEKTTEVENVEVKEVKRVESVEAIREDYEKEESRESGVLLRVDTKFLQTRNPIARMIRISEGRLTSARITHGKVLS